jgi:hypothetical protein
MESLERFAPYAAPENVIRVLDRLHANGVKGPIDADYLTQIGIGAGMAPRTLRALDFLSFRNPDGTATDRLQSYITASPAEAPQVLAAALKSSYDVIFRAVDPTAADRTQVWTAFKTREPSGQWTRMVTLFLGLCRAAGMDVKEPPSDRPGKLTVKAVRRAVVPPGSRAPVKARIGSGQAAKPPPPQLPPAPPPGRLHPAVQAWIDEMPSAGTQWDRSDFESWLAIFKASVERAYRI